MLKRIIAATAALTMSGAIAFGAISGIKSDAQNQQVAMGQTQVGSGTATGNSVTINAGSGVITTAALTTAQNASTAITLANDRIAAGDMVLCTVDPGASAGTPFCANALVTTGQVVFSVGNTNAAALNAAVKIYWQINKAGNPN